MKKITQLFFCFWIIALHAQEKAIPFFKNGEAQIVEGFKDPLKWIRHDLWVETSFDSDGGNSKKLNCTKKDFNGSPDLKIVNPFGESAFLTRTSGVEINMGGVPYWLSIQVPFIISFVGY